MHTLRRTILLATLAALPSLATASGHDWVADYDEAVEIAKKEGKDLLVDFTGSDWCGWCIRLHDEVFSKDVFLAAAKRDYILVSLDFPRSAEAKKKVPNPKRNQDLAAKYQVSGYPTVLLMDVDGAVFGRTGYDAGGPEKYVAHMAKLRSAGKREFGVITAVVDAWEQAKGDAKAVALETMIATMSKMNADTLGLARLVGPVKTAFQMDPKNEQGLKLQAIRALIAVGKMDAEVKTAGREVDPKNATGLLEQILVAECESITKESQLKPVCEAIAELDAMGPIKDPAIAFKLYAVAADWNDRYLDDPEAAKVFAGKAKAVGSDDPGHRQLLQRIDAILDS